MAVSTTTSSSEPRNLIAEDINAYLRLHQHKSLLRFITCGSVDDGKSTLIGRLLYDSKLIFADQLAALEADSKRIGTQGDNIDFALLVDGRCGLSLLLDRSAQIHRRRYAGSRAIHAQHGDRRIDR